MQVAARALGTYGGPLGPVDEPHNRSKFMSDDITTAETNLRLTAMETAMGLMIDVMHQQVNLLSEIAAAVRQEPGESPVVTALDELTLAVVQMGANVETLAQRFTVLPDELAAALSGRSERIDPRTGEVL